MYKKSVLQALKSFFSQPCFTIWWDEFLGKYSIRNIENFIKKKEKKRRKKFLKKYINASI